MQESELRQTLQTVAGNNWEPLPGMDAWAVTGAMLDHIGSTDPELRDGLIYTAFARWSAQQYTPEQKRALLQDLLSGQRLFFGLGEQGTDSVFTRTFSLLWLAVLLYRHRQDPCFSPEEVLETHRRVLDYLEGEQDLRGYVEGKGWAHAAAHCADVLDELALCEELGLQELREILGAIRSKLDQAGEVLCNEEDERLAYAVISLARREVLPEAELAAWLQGFPDPESEDFVTGFRRRLNVKNFLRSLYFQAHYRLPGSTLPEAIFPLLEARNRYK
jgi:hypothetical protein